MIIDSVEFVYSAQYRPPGKRKASYHYFRDDIPVNVSEVSPVDFPVAGRFGYDEDRVSELRTNGTHFFLPVIGTDPEGKSLLSPDKFRSYLRSMLSLHGHGQLVERFGTECYLHAGLPNDVRLEHSDRQILIREIVEDASSFVIVDDLIYRRVGEPFLQYDSHLNYMRPVLVNASERHGVHERPDTLVRPDQMERYFEVMNIEAAPVLGVCEIVRPDVYSFRPEQVQFLAACKEVRKEMHEEIGSQSIEFFTVFASIRDALHAAKEGEVTSELIEASETAIAFFEGSPVEDIPDYLVPLVPELKLARRRLQAELTTEIQPGNTSESTLEGLHP
ncbi:hypothetical protein ACFOY8_14940 [Thalassospira xianhensis]|uniref:Uncharacterized protein n=1 Tax=Thalassospira xianhensis MCCC 1A02616 TaxID=1177929 RepID=A0A367UH69_9PROT|nr:hypothetical protein [Thalassospira xianhensis]RCK07558.1 hypothetical protein TH5_00285 [Thalassospira xianhensis MCCC 1A02616]